MTKVKKTAKKLGRRNAKVGKGVARARGAGVRRGVAEKRVKPATPQVHYTIKPLDALRKCGPGTSVQLLFRVDERRVDRGAVTHLVYFDKHGWYCEHGRSCPAVAAARKYSGQRARGSRAAAQ